MPINKYHGSTKPIVVPKDVFEKLFRKKDYISKNGDTLLVPKYGEGYNTNKNGYIPLSYVWELCNNGTEMIGISNNYQNRIHTFDARWSNDTKCMECKWYYSKKTRNSNGWIRLREPKVGNK